MTLDSAGFPAEFLIQTGARAEAQWRGEITRRMSQMHPTVETVAADER